MAKNQKQARTPRRTEREVLASKIVSSEKNVESLTDRLAKAKAELKALHKRRSEIDDLERADAEGKIAFHRAELERLESLLNRP